MEAKQQLIDKIIDLILEQSQIHDEWGEDHYVKNSEDVANLILDTIAADYVLIKREGVL